MILYIHIPFCASRCSYCAFYTLSHADDYIEKYLITITKEIAHTKIIHGECLEEVTSIFFGGGTPSYIPASYIAEILVILEKYYTFSDSIEITIEGNPESISKEKASIWYSSGVNRVSMGCQSFNSKILTILDRKHSVDDIYRALHNIDCAGFTSISVDLIWGHSYQTKKMWLEDLQKAIDTGVQHISTYSLTVEENSRLINQHALLCTLPSEEELCSMYPAGIQLLKNNNFIQYEVSNFAHKGYSSKHNQGYWNNNIFHSFGPSASSYNGESRYQNPNSLQEWIQLVEGYALGSSKRVPKEVLDKKMACTEAIFLGLRQTKGFYLPLYREYTGKVFEIEYSSILETLTAEGLLKVEDGYCRLEVKGFLVVDEIARYFIQKL